MNAARPYLFRYLATTFSPTKIFTNRHDGSFFKWIMILVVSTAIMAMPLIVAIEGQPVALKTYMPNWTKQVAKNSERSLQQPFQSRAFTFRPADTDEALKGANQLVMLASDRVLLKDKNGYSAEVQLPKNMTAANVKDLATIAAVSWEKQYKPLLAGGKILITDLMLLISNLFILLFGAIILFATRKTGFSTIGSFPEALQILANPLGSSSLIGMIAGFLTGDIALVLLIQSGVWMILLLVSFLQTRFNDKVAETNLKQQKKGAFTHDKATI